MSTVDSDSPALIASAKALEEMYACLKTAKHFRLEAGAGAGKTYSLIEALKYLLNHNSKDLARNKQKIACITFTNVAKDEIISRTDRNPLVHCDTSHAFCWSLIGGFQKQLRALIETIPKWKEKLIEVGGTAGNRAIEYSTGRRTIQEASLTLHHDDILPLTISLMGSEKFRRLVRDSYPIVLIDEYQDTDQYLIEAIKNHFISDLYSPLFGFFGDHWQKIYDGGCGKIEHENIKVISKGANFRSVAPIVRCLNRIRPDLHQHEKDPSSSGQTMVFHTNDWAGPRRKPGRGGHWDGDLPEDIASEYFLRTKEHLSELGWDLSSDHTKFLLLTHKLLAAEQGYPGINSVFRFSESYMKKESRHIAYLVDQLDPACDAFVSRRYGQMFKYLSEEIPLITKHKDKEAWNDAMSSISQLRENGTIGEIIDLLKATRLPQIPESVEKSELELQAALAEPQLELPRHLEELRKLRDIPYTEIQALRKYLDGHSPFETKHGVKGAQFDNVFVVFGRGWNKYNFDEMLRLAASGEQNIPADQRERYEINRNLFYVVCSRAKKNLALLFTQKLSDNSLNLLRQWFGSNNVMSAPSIY